MLTPAFNFRACCKFTAMKKNILVILVLMSLCVVGIIGLQLFWNYQNYQRTVKVFDHDINAALNNAVARETDQRQEEIVRRFKGWLADTSLIRITADHNNRDSATVFYTQDVHPKFKEDYSRKTQFGLADFKEKLNHITPEAKARLIAHFGDHILKRDLKEGVVYHYTQMLGDSLEKVFSQSRMNLDAMALLFRQELKAKNINADFVLNPVPVGKPKLYMTQQVNTHFRKPAQKAMVYAGFERPSIYFFKEMKWLIITSLLLILITIGCFSYTVRTLLSQHKLAELKDSFVNNMTHELNTPIASIKITAEALMAFKHSPETQNEYLSIIAYQADQLSELTSQVLNTGKLVHDHGTNWSRVDLNELISSAIDDLEPQVIQAGALMDYKPAKQATFVNADMNSLGNVLKNLLENALKYNLAQPQIAVVVKTAGGYAEVRISDNGIGIPEAYHSAIFEQFFRVPQGDLHDVKGFGLGLSYVKAVMKQHQAEITVANNQPSGSTFTLKLPLC